MSGALEGECKQRRRTELGAARIRVGAVRRGSGRRGLGGGVGVDSGSMRAEVVRRRRPDPGEATSVERVDPGFGFSSSSSAKSLYSTSSSVDSKFPLYRCMIIVPHDQDSGAFFIAVLHKLSPLNESQMVEVTKTELPLSTDRTVKLQEEPQPEIMLSEKNWSYGD